MNKSGFSKFFVRLVFGVGLILLINQFILPEASSLKVGLNILTLLTCSTLGIPGVGMLYGILLFQNL